MSSTIKKNDYLKKIGAILFWLLVWYLLSLWIDEEIFLPSPLSTLQALFKLLPDTQFWYSIFSSLSRLLLGLALSFAFALFLGILSSFYSLLETLLSPLVKAIRSIPVASIIILILLWVKSKNLSIVISFLVVFPLLYSSTLSAMKETPQALLEMAECYNVSQKKKIRYIYIPHLFPFLKVGLRNAIGMAFKSAIAAEVIALPRHSIGTLLYEAKVYLVTKDLFSYTIVIVLLSFLFEKITFILLEKLERIVEK